MLSPAVASVAQLALIVLYPGYLTFKTLEHDRKKPDAARGWCVYWVVASAWDYARRAAAAGRRRRVAAADRPAPTEVRFF